MGINLAVELIAENNFVLEFLSNRDGLDVARTPEFGFAQEIEPALTNDACGRAFFVRTKKMVAPKIRSKAWMSRRYSFPPFCMPNVSSICAALLNRSTGLCWRTAMVARKMGTIRS